MDSVTQLVLGASVGEAVLGRRVGNKAAIWGAVAGTLPDLDVFVPLGDVVRDFTYHRSASHSLFVLALLTPVMVWIIGKIHPPEAERKGRWMLLIYLVFFTHILLDCFTVYGTQIFWPVSTVPVGWSTIFIIDPLYTLPLLVGVLTALILTRENNRGHLVSRGGLILSSLYLCWTVFAKILVDRQFTDALQEQDIRYEKMLTVPAPFNSLLWRAVVMDQTGYYEAYYSVFDSGGQIRFHHYQSHENLLDGIEDSWPVKRLQWFSRGFYAVSSQQTDIIIKDLRMGVEPHYAFQFKVGEFSNPHARPVQPQRMPVIRDYGMLPSVWDRIWNQSVRLGPGE